MRFRNESNLPSILAFSFDDAVVVAAAPSAGRRGRGNVDAAAIELLESRIEPPLEAISLSIRVSVRLRGCCCCVVAPASKDCLGSSIPLPPAPRTAVDGGRDVDDALVA